MADRVIASGASFCLIGDVRTSVSLDPNPRPFNAACVMSATFIFLIAFTMREASLPGQAMQWLPQGLLLVAAVFPT